MAFDHGLPKDARIGPGARIYGSRYIKLGVHLSAGRGLRLECIDDHVGITYSPILVIGDNVTMGDNVHIGCVERVEIGRHTLFGSGVLVIDHNHGCYGAAAPDSPVTNPQDRKLQGSKVHIGDRVWIGDQAVVLPGASIGAGCVVGAGAIVSGVHQEGLLLIGNPARPVKEWDATSRTWTMIGHGGE